MAELFGTDEKDLRAKTGNLLDELMAGKRKPRRQVARQTTAEKLRKARAAKKQMATKKARRPKEAKQRKQTLVAKAAGFPLVERLLARTKADGWYTHGQLQKLLPETTKGSLHFLLYQKLPRLGWIERRALTEFPRDRWLNTKPGEKREQVMTRPGYVYRIGAELGEERARAREKDAILRVDRSG